MRTNERERERGILIRFSPVALLSGGREGGGTATFVCFELSVRADEDATRMTFVTYGNI